jgi:glycosyltransferase involved in cell wall biosynthesis
MGLHNLIEAMNEVIRAHSDGLLLIVGKGTLQNELDQHIQSKKLAANVCMMGAVSDRTLPLLYKAVDFSVVPTTAYEGFGLIPVESLAAGTPVLGRPVAAIPEVLGPLSESLLLESAAPQHIAAGIHEALAAKRILPSMQACEGYAAANYAWPSIARKIRAVYQEVMSTVK